MSNIRTKLLGLSVLAMAFAGLSYGQTIACTGYNTAVNPNPLLRAEGETELVADAITTGCSNSGVATSGTVTASLSVAITSKSETVSAAYAGNSDAVLLITQACGAAPQIACGVNPVGTVFLIATIPGSVSGSSVTFTVGAGQFPSGTFTVQVSNVRINATLATNPQIVDVLLLEYNSSSFAQAQVAAGLSGGVNVGYVTASLKTTISTQPPTAVGGYGGATSSAQYAFSPSGGPGTYVIGSGSSFPTCSGNQLDTKSSDYTVAAGGGELPTFTLAIQQIFAGAFKVQAQENGSFGPTVVGGVTVGAASQATQLQVTFTNVPAAATIYLPITVVNAGTTLTLQGSGITPLTTPNALANILPFGVYPFTPSGGTVTAVYVVTGVPVVGGANQASAAGTYNLPVYLNVAANAAPVQTTAMTASVAYIPAATITGPQGVIPIFAPSTAVLSTITVTPCQTTLLFPFVTNSSGFETGIEIANMTTDNLAKNGTASSATPTTGTCVLNFYGNVATQPAPFTTSTLGVYSTSPAQAPIYANTLTAMAVPNFSGYAIALCNFLDAHGFAYIVDNFGQSNGTAEGYVANAINGTGRGGPDGGQGQ